MADRWTIFLDDAGTMNDPDVRARQMRAAVGEFLAGSLGGEAGVWAAAHDAAQAHLWSEYRRTMFGNTEADYPTFRRAWLLDWVRGMASRTVVRLPGDDDAAVALALRMEAFATRRVRAAYPGAVESIRALRAAGYTLHTASGEDSAELAGYLEAMGVRGCFGRLYGPDLVATIKEGPLYYERIFADAGVTPDRALVVDDNPL